MIKKIGVISDTGGEAGGVNGTDSTLFILSKFTGAICLQQHIIAGFKKMLSTAETTEWDQRNDDDITAGRIFLIVLRK